MTVTLQEFIEVLADSPAIFITTILVLAVVFVNGWTDAPNAIATAISTRTIEPQKAIYLATLFNFLGVFIMTAINADVAETIFNMVDFNGNMHEAAIALCAAQVSIVIWATGAWYFGIPTSESHALIAGLSGSAIALHGGLSGINGGEWMKNIYGLFLSTFLGFAMGYVVVGIIKRIFVNTDRRKSKDFFKKGQVVSAAAMAFMHGAQDGQKFMGVFMLAFGLVSGMGASGHFVVPTWLMIMVSIVIGFGTSCGGLRIIKSVGINMVKLETYEGFAADIGAAVSLLAASLTGIPISTTHTKTTAIMGVGASKHLKNVNWGLVGEMVLAWLLTFPGCGLIGYAVTYVFIRIF
ncbi:MAG: inorganic phosphate transporter [Peptoniphilus sp.]|nr:inorganic phosphate transporter [Peptoniphilus sp.]MDD7362827.1 inorganic phosphate transporter [Bacillota bacterium]MDY6043981.1 inorganic phosphate transporter [Peptoniphilus sp.]